MKIILTSILLSFCIFSAHASDFDYDKWEEMIIELKKEALGQGISDKIINDLIENNAFIPNVVKRDKNQPEFKITFSEYKDKLISEERISTGKKFEKKYATLLSKAEKKYGVPRHYILAFWGLESNYGEYKARYNLTNSFLTLIYEGRRREFFKKQLFALMKNADKSSLDLSKIKGSWAGAMGHFQFIPTTMEMYAIDGNNDGKIDIINNIPDAIFSAANYLSKLGWDKNYKVLREVQVPENFDFDLADGKTKKKLSDWKSLGIIGKNNKPLPDLNIETSLLSADETNENIFILYDNFYRIKKWNNSTNYALVIGLLAEKLKK